MITRTVRLAMTLLGASLAAAAAQPAAATGSSRPVTPASEQRSRHPVGGMPDSARDYYTELYGVDDLSAQLTDGGALVRFSFRVVDAGKAQALQDRAAMPTMLDAAGHAVLHIPVMEKVGPLRQSMSAKDGMSYWMTFSNRGGPVKAGHKVSVLIGSVRIDGLIVQ